MSATVFNERSGYFVGDPPTGGSSISQGQTSIVLILPLVFLITVIFMTVLCVERSCDLELSGYFVGDPPTGGSSISQGQTSIVLTLPLLFLITVIFMTQSFVRRSARSVLRECRPASLPQIVDDHVDEPGTERAILLRVLRLLALHLILR
jgi:uncharacterized membrane protein YhaH (DUF805 family)